MMGASSSTLRCWRTRGSLRPCLACCLRRCGFRRGDPQFTLNVASFFFLPDGYLLKVFRALDLAQIWSMLVFAQGAHAIDKRRSFGSAAAIALTVMLGITLVAARFM